MFHLKHPKLHLNHPGTQFKLGVWFFNGGLSGFCFLGGNEKAILFPRQWR